jgi:photosystem II stability/assembly factor-like uncharacterized protein
MFPQRNKIMTLTLAVWLVQPVFALAATWVTVTTGDDTTTYHDVHFTDRDNGLIVGENGDGGLILRTQNGGMNPGDWSLQEEGLPGAMWKLFFLPGGTHGWAVGDAATIMYTADGGDSWNSYSTVGLGGAEQLRGVYFESIDKGWVADILVDRIVHKADAGSDWIEVAVPGGPSDYQDLVMTSATHGWATTATNCVVCINESSDGGQFWFVPFDSPPGNLFRMAAIADDNVWVTGEWHAASSAGIFRYNGSSWGASTHPVADLRDIHFAGADDLDGWAVGLASAIMHRESGAGWVQETAPEVGITLEGVFALDTVEAFAVGSDGTILVRTCIAELECDDGDDCTENQCVDGRCENPPVIDGTLCTDNGTYCDGIEACQLGLCQSPGDPCPGTECNTCQESLGTCFDPAGTACTDDGDFCTGTEECDGAGTCASTGYPCGAQMCDPIGEACVDCLEDTDCPFCHICDGSGTCVATPEGQDTKNECDPLICRTGDCDGSGNCGVEPDTTVCNDGLYCTVNDECTGGICDGTGRNCSAASDDCNTGVCNDTSDQCEPQPANQGLPCDDALYCTVGEVCNASGDCTGGAARDCTAENDQCNVGACDDGGDTCYPDPAPLEGQPCDDSDLCTENETCQAGSCPAGNPVDCSGSTDQCNLGTCNPADGSCYPDPAPFEGQACDDQDDCTMEDACTGGSCWGPPTDGDGDGHVWDNCGGDDCADDDENVHPGIFEGPGGDPKCGDNIDNDCDGLTDLSEATCGECFVAADCDNGNVCDGTEDCDGEGHCLVGQALDCDDLDPCTNDSCNPVQGCLYDFNLAPCNDGSECTLFDQCDGAGVCVGTGNPCNEQCLTTCVDTSPGFRCDPTEGVSCNDQDPCTETDLCLADGSCAGSAKDCSHLDSGCYEGVCQAGTGNCITQPMPDGSNCDDTQYCSVNDQCQGGSCVGTTRDCSSVSDDCNTGACDEGLDSCVPNPLPDGTPCDDHLYCTVLDACEAGGCTGDPRDCSPFGDQCNDGSCDEGGNACIRVPANDGNACDDGEYCTVQDICTGGDCGGVERDCSEVAGDCYGYFCDETANECEVGAPLREGVPCEPCGLCDGDGACLASAERDGDDCDDGDVCTRSGICRAGGICVIEGWCDEIVDPQSCDEPAAVYAEGLPDCRLPEDLVAVRVEVEPNLAEPGGFVPVRVWIRNTGWNWVSGSWVRELSRLSLVLHLNPASDDDARRMGSLSYLLGSATLEAGAVAIEELADPENATVTFLLGGQDTGIEALHWWSLDLELVRGPGVQADAAFDIEVLAPCAAELEQVACHDDGGVQPVSNRVRAGPRAGTYLESSLDAEEPASLGCSCGSRRGTGVFGWLLVAALVGMRRRRTR